MESALSGADAALVEIAHQQESERLTFMLGESSFTLDIQRIRAIVAYGALAPAPDLPPFVRGVVEVAGSAVPVVDLGVRIGGRPRAVGADTRIVVIEVAGSDNDYQMGIVVDAIVTNGDGGADAL